MANIAIRPAVPGWHRIHAQLLPMLFQVFTSVNRPEFTLSFSCAVFDVSKELAAIDRKADLLTSMNYRIKLFIASSWVSNTWAAVSLRDSAAPSLRRMKALVV